MAGTVLARLRLLLGSGARALGSPLVKVVLLAGGFGTRLSEETTVRPKPMVEIGDQPILWHIMKIYAAHGMTDFVICCGYKGELIKEYFESYALRMADVTFDLGASSVEFHGRRAEPWRVTLVDTGVDTMTGGRLLQVRDHVGDETFCATYGDGVADVDITRLVAFHREQKTLATLTAVQPEGRFGAVLLQKGQTLIEHFREKPEGDGAWINGGFFVLEPQALDYIEDDLTVFELEPLRDLARDRQLAGYRHDGFWHPMDTIRDREHLQEMWEGGSAPWKVWE
jgi:glucose-1-phosphate cytidylyltransferase